MLRRSILAVAFAFAAILAFAVPQAALAAPPGQGLPSGLSYPIAATTAQGTFNGTLRVVAFAVQNGALVASGIVSGTVVDATGVASSITQTVSIPVNMAASGASAA